MSSLDEIRSIVESNQQLPVGGMPRPTGQAAPAMGDMGMEQGGDMGVGDYALDILTAVPKGIVGAARDIVSLPYLPLQAGAGLPEIPDYFGLFDPPKTMAGSIVDTLSGFATGYGAVAKGLGLVGRATTLGQRAIAASRAANVAAVQRFGATGGRLAEVGTEFLRTSTISGITSGLVFDGNEERLSNLLRDELGFTDPITEYLAADENDSELEGRLKNVIEDFLLGGVAEIGIQAVKATARAGINQLRVHRAGVKAKLAGLDPDEAMAREMRIVSEEQEVAVSRALNTTLDESRQVLRMVDATGAARENFAFMSRTEMEEWAAKNGKNLEEMESSAKGFATMDKAGKVLIGGFKGASLDTAIHEVSHGIRMMVVDPNVANKVLSNSDIGTIAEAAGAVRRADGTVDWTVDSEERFVELFSRYLLEGVVPNRKAKAAFTKLTGWVRQYYADGVGEFADSLDPVVRQAFDNLMNNGVDGAINRASRIQPDADVLLQRRFDAAAALPTRGKAAQLKTLLSPEELASIKSQRSLDRVIETFARLETDIKPLFKALSEAGAAGQGGYQEGERLFRRLVGDTRTELSAMFSGATSAQNRVSNHTKLGMGITADFIERIRTGNLADMTQAEMVSIVKAVGNRHGIRGMSEGYARTSLRIANDLLGRLRTAREANPQASLDDLIDSADTSGLYRNLKGAGMEPGAGKTPGYAEGAAGRLDRPALDTYMVRVLPDSMFPGVTGSKLIDAKKKWIASAPNYVAMVATVRNLAKSMDILPGENQERIWTSIVSIVALKKLGVQPKDVLKNMDKDDILASWDLLSIFKEPEVTNELRRLGADEGSLTDLAGIAADVRRATRPFTAGGVEVTDPRAFARAAGRISGGGGAEVLKARRARGALLKATAADFTPEGIKNITKRDDWAILTAENPGNVTKDAAENARLNSRLEDDLIAGGYEYVKITGKYGKEMENSFLVLGINPAKAQDFGRSYSQEAVLTREGLLYRDGTVNPAKRAKLLKDDAADYYSEVNGTKFALDIDFGKRQPSQLVPAIPTTDTPVLLRSQPPMRDFGGPERVLFQKKPGTIGIAPTFRPKAEYGKKTPGASSVVAIHFSQQERQVLDTSFYATNWPGEEAARLSGAKDKRLLKRTYFYVDTSGEGIRQEVGVGQQMHAVRLNNMYDASKDPKGVIRKANSDDPNVWESAIIKAGYDGYFTNQDMAVVLGQHEIPVQFIRERSAGARGTVLFQERGYQMEPGSPGLGTPSGRGGEPRTTINFARFSTEQSANEQAKEWMDTYIEATAGSETLSIEQQIARAESAKGELLDALGVQDFGSLEQFMRGPAGAGATLDASKRIMASRQLLADIGGYAANLGRRHKTAGHAEMYDFLRAQQMMKFLGHYVKQEVREAARIMGAQRAVFVPDPDFKILPSFEAPAPRATPEVPPRMPQEATAPGTPLGATDGAVRPPEASTGPEMASPGAMPPDGATGVPAGALEVPAGTAGMPTGALPAPASMDPDVVAKAMAQAINDAGGEMAVRAQMHRTAMAHATGNPLAVAKLSRAQRFGNVLTEYFMNSILSGPTTHVINIAGNSLVSMYLPLEKALGASIRGIAGGQGASNSLRMAGEHLRAYRHMFHVFKDSMTFAGTSFKADRNILDNMTTVEQKGRAISAAGLGMTEGTLAANAVNWLGKALNIPTRVLSSTDEMFKQMNYRAALLTELEVEGLARFNGDARQASVWADQTMNKMIENGQAYSEKVVLQKAMTKADEAVAAGTIRADERSSYIARFMADTNNWDPELGALSERAMDYSRYATFSTPLVVGEGGRISRVSARIQQVAEESTAIRFIMPFIRTPTRILEFALDRSIPGQPYNLKNAFGELKSKLSHSERAVRDEAMGRVAFAVMTTYGLFHMIAAGGITGDGPSNPTERQAWLEAGNQPYSVRFGDSWVSYRRLDPFASMMGLVVDTMDSYGRASERQKPQLEAVVNSIIVGIANNFTNKSYLTGVTSILEAIKDPERYGDKLVNQYVSAMVPYSSALRQAKGTVDDDLVVRDVRGMLDAVMNTVPVAARAVEPRRNIFGEPIKRAEGWGPDWASPITYTRVSDDLIMNEFNLVGHSFDAPRETRNGMNLTEVTSAKGQTAYDRWQELHGQVKVGGKGLRQALTQLIKSRQYQMMSPETTDMYESPRVRALRQVVEKYRSAAFTQLMREIPEVRQGVDRDFAVKRALKTGRPVDELMALTNR